MMFRFTAHAWLVPMCLLLATPAPSLASQLCGSPRHLHLAVGKDPSTSMTVSFASPPCKDDIVPTGAVLYGVNPNQLDRIVVDSKPPARYNAITPLVRKNSTQPYVSDYLHHIQMEDLEPNSKYYYRCVILPGDLEAEQILQEQNKHQGNKDYEEDEEADFGRYLRSKEEGTTMASSLMNARELDLHQQRLLATTIEHEDTEVFLKSGETLDSHTILSLPSYDVTLRQQTDGNLVLYKLNETPDGGSKSAWSAKVVYATAEFYTTLQGDGNLIIRKGTIENEGPLIWSSGKIGPEDDYFLAYDPTEKGLMIRSGTPDNPGSMILWKSKYGGHKAPPPPPEMKGSFITAPLPGEGAGYTKLVFMGDLSQTSRTRDTMAVLQKFRKRYAAIILAGDLAYPDKDPRKWESWFDLMDDYSVTADLPLHVAPGNHDIDRHEFNGEIYVAYEQRFMMPQVQPPTKPPYNGEQRIEMYDIPWPLEYEYGNAYYSFIYGLSYNIILSSYSDFAPGSIQYEWLVKELESVDRTVTPWLLVTMHCPMYNTFALHTKDIQMKKAREILEPLFVKHKVNVVFAGHIHAYMRTPTVINGTVDVTGPMNIIIGDGGRKAFAPFQREEPEEWVAVRDSTYYGYGTFDLINRTHAQWEWIHTAQEDVYNYVISKNGEELPPAGVDDTFVVNQYFL
mmetsp:Transcript_14786/g.23127  ORF Transcript_14786/g.23127 Transcript_14786/m.23127 type:complete len:679 (-) Transcript_14786:102-2138(-)|eukprot:CAMPEP_0195286360 /NCGR_PEP_ID=MMETSP0707-20130614/3850_1 /TAXON_ID=33640 /ORGANISM="Asterionellopsis glacialis, Strain CCMP134" /LENGTH=678 /DNA_ID=CAMNT_0040345993 /DNA_START=127 /DNA_END=2163 /DNA_ORIENTATION=+